jgi:thiamine pyrophosphate-dependent acetolactate synthase large subunit-like protein
MWGKGRHVATELGMVNYEKAAQGLGAQGELVERAEDITPAMKRALGSGRIACLNIVTDSEVIEPGTLAMYSAGAAAQQKREEKPAEGEGTTLPYYGKRKLE